MEVRRDGIHTDAPCGEPVGDGGEKPHGLEAGVDGEREHPEHGGVGQPGGVGLLSREDEREPFLLVEEAEGLEGNNLEQGAAGGEEDELPLPEHGLHRFQQHTQVRLAGHGVFLSTEA
ncbi:Hypothetical protein AA314_00097 [Archangium gephyra]|uniref:Uncharacterized protein n=1 Tax=Archangium gephyra TaxID=48 RepID=A0AAC8TBI9_9BACT|nr:Hypothetical protein AA314_00097 [Archangium gephyra]